MHFKVKTQWKSCLMHAFIACSACKCSVAQVFRKDLFYFYFHLGFGGMLALVEHARTEPGRSCADVSWPPEDKVLTKVRS